jgi:hypothetical protein
MHHLAARVDAAIRAAGARNGDGLSRDRCKRCFERVLHGPAPGLGLPPEKPAAVVFDAQCNSHK